MISKNKNSRCGKIKAWLHRVAGSRLGLDAAWVQKHIADCPKCRQRLALLGRVNLALSMIKSQPHSLDLLMRANAQAIGVLRHSLRYSPKAHRLKAVRPEPKLWERCRKYTHSVANAAACIAIVILMKTGIFSYMNNVQTQGRNVVKHYYAAQVGQDMADDMFST
ncbi:MAG TPA: hypothetical protein VMW16_13965 [Sedimentisphaerales bacterium]|nr:hypothetical protein [Sedimentisphaerales bacterium]